MKMLIISQKNQVIDFLLQISVFFQKSISQKFHHNQTYLYRVRKQKSPSNYYITTYVVVEGANFISAPCINGSYAYERDFFCISLEIFNLNLRPRETIFYILKSNEKCKNFFKVQSSIFPYVLQSVKFTHQYFSFFGKGL